MTAARLPADAQAAPARTWAFVPAEGWLTVGLVALLAVALAWAIDDARWVLGRGEYTDFLQWAALGGVLAGLTGAKSGWSRWASHLAGAVAAAVVVPLLVGSVMLDGWVGIAEQYKATAGAVSGAWIDVIVNNHAFTRQYGHHLLALGIILWGSGQFAAYTVFGHRRPLDAVITLGLVLLLNMAITSLDQLGYLVVFTVAALFLLARSHAFEEQTAWVRRRIGDPSAVRALYLRGGTAFIVFAVLGSLALTASATSTPLAPLWAGLPDRLYGLTQDLQRFLPVGGPTRPGGVAFGPNPRISGSWAQEDRLGLVVRLAPGAPEGLYWRASTYDRFDGQGWGWSGRVDLDRGVNEPLLAGTADEPPQVGHSAVTFTVQRLAYTGGYLLSPESPILVDRSAQVITVGNQRWFGAVEIQGDGSGYQVTAAVPVEGDEDPLGLTENRLRAAGRIYPPEIVERYLAIPPDVMGPDAHALLDEILALPRSDNPYDLAKTMESFFKSSRFTYRTSVLDLPCEDLSVVECFARYRQGYCEYYASTMAILLREAGVPARYAMGFLPGDRLANGTEEINLRRAHAWVEVYFPTYGWVRFDPTGGGVGQERPLPSGEPVPTGRPTVSVPPRPTIFDPDSTDLAPPGPGPDGAGGSTDSASRLPLIVIALLLAVSVGALAFTAWRRGPRGEVSPEAAWRGVARLAARFGFGPRPTQTVYEYAGALGDVLPGSRPELETVARAKVEVAYGHRELGDDRMRALREAHRRLRVGLLRLAFRRGERRRRR